MAQFYRTGVISGDSSGSRIAAEMNDNLVDVRTGVSSQVLLSSPNADETNSLRMTRTLANLLVACVNSHAATAALLSLTVPRAVHFHRTLPKPWQTLRVIPRGTRSRSRSWRSFLSPIRRRFSPCPMHGRSL